MFMVKIVKSDSEEAVEKLLKEMKDKGYVMKTVTPYSFRTEARPLQCFDQSTVKEYMFIFEFMG